MKNEHRVASKTREMRINLARPPSAVEAVRTTAPNKRRQLHYLGWGLWLLGAMAWAQPTSPFGVSVSPPVPVAGQPYSIQVKGASAGPPITVDNVSAVLVGAFVEVTYFLTHGSSSSAPAAYQSTSLGPLLPAGTYTLRVYTRDRSSAQGSYTNPALTDYSLQLFVAASGAVGTAIEFYNQSLNHYFMTANDEEIAVLDQGVIAGWNRTGQSYPGVYLDDANPNGGSPLAPVCRYYGLPSAGLNTHFFSAFPSECFVVTQLWPNSWILETTSAFFVSLPDISNGECPHGTSPLYRLFNGKPDVNHRYVTSLELRQQMIDQGWIAEGYGPIGVVMCTGA